VEDGTGNDDAGALTPGPVLNHPETEHSRLPQPGERLKRGQPVAGRLVGSGSAFESILLAEPPHGIVVRAGVLGEVLPLRLTGDDNRFLVSGRECEPVDVDGVGNRAVALPPGSVGSRRSVDPPATTERAANDTDDGLDDRVLAASQLPVRETDLGLRVPERDPVPAAATIAPAAIIIAPRTDSSASGFWGGMGALNTAPPARAAGGARDLEESQMTIVIADRRASRYADEAERSAPGRGRGRRAAAAVQTVGAGEREPARMLTRHEDDRGPHGTQRARPSGGPGC
jgi:hypothetical protein